MSNRRKLARPPRNALYDQLAGPMLAAGYRMSNNPTRTVQGTVLDRWVRSLSPDGLGIPSCGHAVPGQPAALNTDDPHPMIRCLACVQELAITIQDDRICHLCGKASGAFREFIVPAEHGLVISGNACPECFTDIWRGRPVTA